MEIVLPEIYKKPLFDESIVESDFWGGRARGASYTATFFYLTMLITSKYFRGYMMRFIYSDVRGSLWRDLMDRIQECNIPENLFRINETSMSIEYIPNGNTIISKGFRKSQGSSTAKLKSIAGATHIIIEECEEIPEYDYLKLKDSLRTNKSSLKILRLWNPPQKSHWLIKNYFNLTPTEYADYFTATPKIIEGYSAVYSNYKDNIENLNLDAVKRFENYQQTNIEHYLTDVIGLIPSGAKGRVYKKYSLYKELPDLDFYTVFGLDFGFSNDPSVLVECNFYRKQRKVYIKEHFRKQGMSTASIANEIKIINPNNSEIICDSSEPREIDELVNYALNAFKCSKGAGSIEGGINTAKGYEIFVHENSKGLLQEFETYKYALDANKEPTNKPEDCNNHGLDAFRYAVIYYNKIFSYTYE